MTPAWWVEAPNSGADSAAAALTVSSAILRNSHISSSNPGKALGSSEETLTLTSLGAMGFGGEGRVG